ncbi:MAG: cytochrome c biogenesis protein CcdA [Anaerolineaceae bacterium]|nr:cytochrome c biogenesis protein CcdA [Anaerolineaceae bacterium]
MSFSLVAFFIAGLLSFLSPCILPLLPGYMGLIGTWGNEGVGRRQKIFLILMFIVGFTLVFLSLGLTATLLGNLIFAAKSWVARVGGVVIFLLGLHLAGILNIPFLNYEKKISFSEDHKNRYFVSLLMGVVFSAGWSPCIGPLLGSLLTALVVQSTPILAGVLCLFSYSLGLGIPIFLVGVLENEILRRLIARKKVLHYIQVGSGILLVITGLMLVFNLFPIFSGLPSLFTI